MHIKKKKEKGKSDEKSSKEKIKIQSLYRSTEYTAVIQEKTCNLLIHHIQREVDI